MTISIQPLDSNGKPTDKLFTSDWATFLDHNDGFTIQQAAHMTACLTMGSGYLLGDGPLGQFRLKRISP